MKDWNDVGLKLISVFITLSQWHDKTHIKHLHGLFL